MGGIFIKEGGVWSCISWFSSQLSPSHREEGFCPYLALIRSIMASSFWCSCPVFPALLFEEAVFFPLYVLASFVIDKLPIGAWVYLWAFIPLVYISVFVAVPYCLNEGWKEATVVTCCTEIIIFLQILQNIWPNWTNGQGLSHGLQKRPWQVRDPAA